MAIKVLNRNRVVPYVLSSDRSQPKTEFFLRALSPERRDAMLEELSNAQGEDGALRVRWSTARWRELFVEVVARVAAIDLDDGHGTRTVQGGTKDMDALVAALPGEAIVEVAAAALSANVLSVEEKKDSSPPGGSCTMGTGGTATASSASPAPDGGTTAAPGTPGAWCGGTVTCA